MINTMFGGGFVGSSMGVDASAIEVVENKASNAIGPSLFERRNHLPIMMRASNLRGV